jgi:hypothetical protein
MPMISSAELSFAKIFLAEISDVLITALDPLPNFFSSQNSCLLVASGSLPI